MNKLISIGSAILASSGAYASGNCDQFSNFSGETKTLAAKSSYLASNEGTVITVINCNSPSLGYNGAPAVNLKSGECGVETDNYTPVLFVCEAK